MDVKKNIFYFFLMQLVMSGYALGMQEVASFSAARFLAQEVEAGPRLSVKEFVERFLKDNDRLRREHTLISMLLNMKTGEVEMEFTFEPTGDGGDIFTMDPEILIFDASEIPAWLLERIIKVSTKIS